MDERTYAELTAAIKIHDTSLRAFARTLISPRSGKSISNTAIRRVAKGLNDTAWIQDAIQSLIDSAKAKNPDYFNTEVEFLLSKTGS